MSFLGGGQPALSNAARRPASSAPWMRATSLPSLKTRNVGSADTAGAATLRHLVDVHFREERVGAALGELVEDGRDALAGAAPGRAEVHSASSLLLLAEQLQLVERRRRRDGVARASSNVEAGARPSMWLRPGRRRGEEG